MSYSCLRIIFLFLLFVTVIPPFSVIDSFLFFMCFLHLIGVLIFKVCLSSYKKLNIFITQNSSSSLLLSYQHRASQTIPYPVNLFPVVSSRKVSVCAPKKVKKNHKTMWGSKWLKFLCSQYRLSIRKQLRLYFGPADRS